jgi:hypothetical protein
MQVHTQKRAQSLFVRREIQELGLATLHAISIKGDIESSTKTQALYTILPPPLPAYHRRHQNSNQPGRPQAADRHHISQHVTTNCESCEEAEMRLLYRENKEQDITTVLGRTKAISPRLRKRTRQ